MKRTVSGRPRLGHVLIDLQYGASEAGYSAIPQNVYKQVEHAFMAYKITDRAASSPPRWVIMLAQPYDTGFTM